MQTMNRYARSSGPSKASATTLCQKCLKKGHYSYECTASQQDRPYTSRPSRTQQLLNPRLAPKIADQAAKDGLEPNALASLRSKRAQSEDSESVSVSTISTRSSRSRSPRRRDFSGISGHHSRTADLARKDVAPQTASRRRSSSTQHIRRRAKSPSSALLPHIHIDRSGTIEQRGSSPMRARSRERDAIPTSERSAYRSRSPYIKRRESYGKGGKPNVTERPPRRDRSLSPYSRRLAMTQAVHSTR
ncbi:hypothetical protein EJ03DRAFT_178825 [Teratosphaeria nubilosa]|uniref:Zinc knuckle-domain-containing protein n=1 Tax=Teratosphaeria nubilosa TaxID=161662 RepID=A0A6G1L1E3_9PEZI|nr:hypothetical protein EJ03DRAFT_178825 [Teratosphaeria nubilosa]